MKKEILALIFILSPLFFMAQEIQSKDKAVYKEVSNGYYQDSILSRISEFQSATNDREPGVILSTDFTGMRFPTDTAAYLKYWNNQPVSQGRTGTCWSFASTSFMESEVYRITGRKVKLSEIFFVYWEYIERAKYYVANRGKMAFGEGSEANAVPKLMKLYGAVPAGAFTGKLFGQRVHDHEALFGELDSYLKKVKDLSAWNEETVVSTVKQILKHYIGEPPSIVKVDGVNYSPVEYLKNILNLKPENYFSFMSTKSQTYNQRGELDEPDNWWHSDDYYNIHLDDFLGIAEDALAKGFSVCVCGDVSEPGYDKYTKAGIIPTFDIPADYIDEDSREYRLNNQITYDDHCLHIVGSAVADGKTWLMIKDSGSGAFDSAPQGYRFISEDYFRLKIITLMVHNTAAKKVLDKIIK
jgi:bleomycin hydrolase